MNNRFGDICNRKDCEMNKLQMHPRIRYCDGLNNTDFGGECGGENCNFYKPRQKKKTANSMKPVNGLS